MNFFDTTWTWKDRILKDLLNCGQGNISEFIQNFHEPYMAIWFQECVQTDNTVRKSYFGMINNT